MPGPRNMHAVRNASSYFFLCERGHARFACLLSDWVTTTGRVLGHATCLPHKDGGMSLNALPKDTSKQACQLVLYTIPMC